MTIISALKTYLKTYSGLKEDAPVWVDALGPTPTEYAIIPLSGDKVIKTYIDGSSERSFPFAFQSMESTADELERLENIGFYEAFAAWLESQTNSDILPSLGTGKTTLSIEALGWGYLYQEGESKTGVYQITCRLTYEQDAP